MKMKQTNTIIILIALVDLLLVTNAEASDEEYNLKTININIPNVLEIYSIDSDPLFSSNISTILRTNEKLLFCDSLFNIIRERDIVPDGRTKIHPSKKYRYFLLEEYLSLAETKAGVGHRRWTLMDYQGNTYYTDEEKLGYDFYNTRKRVISDLDGTLYELETSTAEFIVRSRTGEELKRLELYENFDYKYSGQNGYIDISEDGSIIAVVMNRQNFVAERQTKPRTPIRGLNAGKQIPGKYIEGQSGEPYLFIFDEKGDVIQTKPLLNETAWGVGISPEGNYIWAMSHTSHPYRHINNTKTTIFDSYGNVLGNYPFILDRYLFSQDFLIGEVKERHRKIICINLDSGNTEWVYNVPKSAVKLIRHLAKDTIGIITTQGINKQQQLTECLIRLFDKDSGIILQTIEIGKMPKGTIDFHNIRYIPRLDTGISLLTNQ